MTDVVILEFGATRTSVHTAEGYTHSTWFVAKSQASLEKALDALVESQGSLTPEEG